MSQVIIRRKAGQEIPEGFFKAALAACPKAWGLAYTQDGKLELNHGEGIDLDDLRATEKNTGDFTLCLVDSSGAVNLKDVPPFELAANGEDEPVVAVAIDGDFPGFAKEKSSHPPMYHLANFVGDKVTDMLNILDGDLDKTFSKMANDDFKDKIKMNAVSRGYLTFLGLNDKAVTIFQGDTAKEYPWGWVSNTFNWDGGGTKVEEPKKKGLFKSTVREKATTATATDVVDTQKKANETETAVKPKGENAPPKKETPKPVVLTLENITVKKVKCPEHYSRKEKRRWAKTVIGHIPPTLDDPTKDYEVYMSPTNRVLSREEVSKALGYSASQLPPLNNPKHEKNPDPDNIDAGKQVDNQPLPILSPTGRNRLRGFLADERIVKIISERGDVISDPDKVQSHEAKIEPIFAQLGMKNMDDLYKLPFPEVKKIAAANFHDICCMYWGAVREVIQLRNQVAKLQKDTPKTEEQPEAAVAPKSGGLFKRRTA